MDRITLANVDNVDLKALEYEEVNDLSDLVRRRAIKDSLTDKGITRFKEVTDFNKISFGHFIVIEKILAYDIELEKKIKMIAPIILRPLDEEKLDNSNQEREEEHRKLVFEEPIGNIYGTFTRLLEIRKTYLFKTYNGVIYGTLDESEEEEEKEEGTNIGSTQSAREFHNKKFFWNSMISLVANGDIFKFDQAVELMMYVVMPFFAEKRSLEIIQDLEQKQRRK